MGHTAKAQPLPATETQAVSLKWVPQSASPGVRRYALIDRRFQGGSGTKPQAHGALTSRKFRRLFRAEPGVRMALEIDTLQCTVGVETSAARKSDCSAGTGVQISEVLMCLPFTPEVMQVKMRIVLNRHIGRNITVQATRIR
jgi:hypothetical protein